MSFSFNFMNSALGLLLFFKDDRFSYLSDISNRKQLSPGASMKKMFTLTTTRLFGAHGGRIINGAINAASRQYAIAIALVLLVLRRQRLQAIL